LKGFNYRIESQARRKIIGESGSPWRTPLLKEKCSELKDFVETID
jgi:hypothetical protein